jgi:hypothetical protein
MHNFRYQRQRCIVACSYFGDRLWLPGAIINCTSWPHVSRVEPANAGEQFFPGPSFVMSERQVPSSTAHRHKASIMDGRQQKRAQSFD